MSCNHLYHKYIHNVMNKLIKKKPFYFKKISLVIEISRLILSVLHIVKIICKVKMKLKNKLN